MEKFKRLPDSELDIMLVIWEAKEPVSRAYIEQQIKKKKKIAATTVLTLLSRLCDKGFVSCEKKGNMNLYTAIVNDQDYKNSESRSIIKKLYGNSLKTFVASFCMDNKISDDQLNELQAFLDQLKERRK
ncbi:BlaI/MecI/CopY family transcriptional regulator [Acetivibrio clariflavus]|uniref:Putative transcriptional regulator n=1 Tax=Acetivibrio clariflavus (strain DSM 19732 / NBRC 101661 / EBR45) TaxID=720554 RepID=G8LW19_ACECE|nr:BlaI/MecI/CopY family transcriptional regulator [Acetivibrio clariflavus]AEV68623.1 putative transcriptional regulator [Acetivibrio clariflavus DSM 19732]